MGGDAHMGISDVISLLGGIALFLFGMSLMGDGLKKVAGSKLELVLYRLSSTPLKGVLLGTGVTAVIQSSSATSVMVVGFVNSGMMKVRQAIGVIMGAILGTSVTGWILCLNSLSGGSGWVDLLSTATLTGLFAIVGILLRMVKGKPTRKHLGNILLGFAVLMYGMTAMSGAVAPLKESQAFIDILTKFSNPLLGILVGILAALLYKDTLFRGEPIPFVMELPNYRLPSIKNVAQLLWEKAKDFLQRAFSVILIATVVVWFLQSFDLHLNMVSDSADSMLAMVAGVLVPLFAPLGLGDWRICTALLSGFMAKESVVATLEVLFGGSIATLLSPLAAASLLVFSLLYTPCIAAVASVRRELGGKWAVGLALWQCLIAWVAAFVTHGIGLLL